VLLSNAHCRLPRPDREVLSITALETNPDTGLADDDAASPELALIDSTLRERLARASPMPPAVRAPEVAAEAPASAVPHPRRIRLTALVVVALLVAVGGAWYLLARGGSPATPAAAAAPRVFAWAPVAGIRAYAVEIRRGGVVIYAARTTEPRLRMPARWVRRGSTFTLARGSYQWYVWPIRPGSQFHEPSAIVAASFRVAR
jgi:hypothetical protein